MEDFGGQVQITLTYREAEEIWKFLHVDDPSDLPSYKDINKWGRTVNKLEAKLDEYLNT